VDLAWAGDEAELGEVRDRARAWLRRAARLAIDRFEIDDGLALLDRALDLDPVPRSEEHTSELQSLAYLVCRLLLEKKKTPQARHNSIFITLFITHLREYLSIFRASIHHTSRLTSFPLLTTSGSLY